MVPILQKTNSTMKQVSVSTIFLLGLVTSVVAQYGIPDEDDKPAMRIPLRFSPPAHAFKTPTTTSPPAYHEPVRSEPFEIHHQVPAYAELPTVFKTVVEIREEQEALAYDNKPAVKAPEKPHEAPVSSAHVTFKEAPTSSSTYTPSTRFNIPSTIVKENYPASQPYNKETVPILKFLLEDDSLGNYHFETVHGDGTVQSERGYLKNLGGKEGSVQVKSGSYSFSGDDGKVYRTDWTADELGFNAVGDHLPTTPAPIN